MDEIIAGIGKKIHLLRQGEGLSLQQLAERSGVSAASIHKIERSTMVPTITVLMKLARALDRSIQYLVDEDSGDPAAAVLVRAKDRETLSASRNGVSMENIAGPSDRFALGATVVTIAPGHDSGKALLTHSTEQLVYLLSGSLDFEIDKAYRLRQGDSLHLEADRPHQWRNPSTRSAKAVWISLRSRR